MVGERGRNLVFLLGVPRSGTTLLGAMLSNHPQVLCPPEPWIMLALHAVGKTNPRHPADAQLLGEATRQFLDHDAAIAAMRACAAAAYNSKLAAAQRSVFVDKTPRYYLILPFLEEVFPEARYIWLKRNPFDVVASYKSSWGVDVPKLFAAGAGSPFEHDIILGLRWLNDFARRRADSVYAVSYEWLVRDPQGWMRHVLDHLALPHADVVDDLGIAREALHASKLGDRKILATSGVHTHSIGTGMNVLTTEELQIVYDAIGPALLTQLGYGDLRGELASRGVHEPAAETTQIGLERAEKTLRVRWDLLEMWSSVDTQVPNQAVRDEIIGKLQSHIASLTAHLQGVSESLERTQTTLAEREAFLQAVLNHRAELTKQFEAYRISVESRPASRHFKEMLKAIARRVLNWMCRPPRNLPLPKITIVTPVFNGEAHIRETIESVLNQRYPNLEYIIVDGGSTDGTMKIVREFEDRLTCVISEPDKGMYDAVAKGFDRARGEVLGYLNADDVFEPGALQRIGEFFRDHPKAMVAYREDTITAQGWRFPNAHQPHVDMFDLLRGHILFQDGVHFRKEAYLAVGGMNRELRLAGDYDLWLRLSRPFKFHRVPGHVSSFRIRAGQLSGNMPPYWEEQKKSQEAMRRSLRVRTYVKRIPRWMLNRLRNAWEKMSGPRRLFFPMDFHGPLAGGIVPDPNAPPPKCPLTGRPPDRLLFSSRDTRFGDSRINYIYFCDESQTAVVWPPLSTSTLTALYEKNYSASTASGGIVLPPEGLTSPYRHYRQPRKWRRIWKRLRIPGRIAKEINRKEKVDWNEVCMNDLLGVLRGRFRLDDPSVRMLDVGCFEAGLLDTVKKRTQWRTCGIESNSAAVSVARKKGHNVWQCGAEDAVFNVPAGEQFEIIYLGQTIEHFDDPLRVVRCLATMLAPGGVMVLATPNLDSRQLDLFGPTWAHWHVPYHRVLFGRTSLRRLGELAGLKQVRCHSHSHSYWTAYSVQLNQLGVAGAVSHMWQPTEEVLRVSRSLAAWARLLWNWRGRGDYLIAMFERM